MLEPKISLNDRSHYQKTLDSFFKSVKWNSFAQQHVEKSKQLNLTSARSSADGSHTVATLGDENPYSNEPLLPSPTHMKSFTAPHPSTVVVIDAEKQREILKPFRRSGSPDLRPTPSCSAHEWLLFSQEERKALYRYTLQCTVPPPTPPELKLQSADSIDAAASDDVRAQRLQRDKKRRRQAYRTTATAGRTLSEVTREMIGNIMELIGAGDAPATPAPTTSDTSGEAVVRKRKCYETTERASRISSNERLFQGKSPSRDTDCVSYNGYEADSRERGSRREEERKRRKIRNQSDSCRVDDFRSSLLKTERSNYNDSRIRRTSYSTRDDTGNVSEYVDHYKESRYVKVRDEERSESSHRSVSDSKLSGSQYREENIKRHEESFKFAHNSDERKRSHKKHKKHHKHRHGKRKSIDKETNED